MTSTNPCLIQDINKSLSHTRHQQIHISYNQVRHQQIHISYKTSTKTLDHHKHNTEYKSTYDPPDPAVATRLPHPQTHATDTIQSPTPHSNTQTHTFRYSSRVFSLISMSFVTRNSVPTMSDAEYPTSHANSTLAPARHRLSMPLRASRIFFSRQFVTICRAVSGGG